VITTKLKRISLSAVFLALCFFQANLIGEFLHTVDRKVYEGKMVAFKESVVFFNVYKFGKIYETKRFSLNEIWKIEFNEPGKAGLASSFEVEQNYSKLRRGKRSKTITLEGTQNWVDTGIDVRSGQNILFSASGSIFIDRTIQVYQNGDDLNMKWDKKKPLPNMPTGAIIGKIGVNGPLFYIGDDQAPKMAPCFGRLFIGINDFDFRDNSGKFIITIYY
jgi:hypothetical protein